VSRTPDFSSSFSSNKKIGHSNKCIEYFGVKWVGRVDPNPATLSKDPPMSGWVWVTPNRNYRNLPSPYFFRDTCLPFSWSLSQVESTNIYSLQQRMNLMPDLLLDVHDLETQFKTPCVR
jgi:hypothetical protein